MIALRALYLWSNQSEGGWPRQRFGFYVDDRVKVRPDRYHSGKVGVVVGFTDATVRVRIDWCGVGVVYDFNHLDLQRI